MPGLDEVLAAAHVVRVPLRVRFRGIEAREAVLLDGPAGWGEFAPFTEYADPEASRWLAAGACCKRPGTTLASRRQAS